MKLWKWFLLAALVPALFVGCGGGEGGADAEGEAVVETNDPDPETDKDLEEFEQYAEEDKYEEAMQAVLRAQMRAMRGGGTRQQAVDVQNAMIRLQRLIAENPDDPGAKKAAAMLRGSR